MIRKLIIAQCFCTYIGAHVASIRQGPRYSPQALSFQRAYISTVRSNGYASLACRAKNNRWEVCPATNVQNLARHIAGIASLIMRDSLDIYVLALYETFHRERAAQRLSRRGVDEPDARCVRRHRIRDAVVRRRIIIRVEHQR